MEQLGMALARVVDRSTGSAPQSIERPNYSAPTTIIECRALAEYALTLPVREPIASDAFINNRLDFMEATLPTRNVNEKSGEKRVSVYVAVLRGQSREALTFMADRAIRRLKWFPTPKECLDILADYRAPLTERETVLKLCSDFVETQFETWLANADAGQPLGDVPEQWIRIAVERGVIRRLPGGVYVSRSRYHGPVKRFA